jgi:putative hemolysin
MPADFERCVKRGGRVRTKKLSGGKYIKICFLDGKSYAGETHTAKDPKARSWIKSAYNKK